MPIRAFGRTARVVLCAGLAALATQASPGEPKYSGRTLGEWIEALADLNPEYRAEARGALAHFGKQAVPALQKVMEGPDPEAAALAGGVLIGLGESGRAALTDALVDSRESVRRAAVEALDRSDADNGWAVPALQALTKDPELFLAAQRVVARLASAAPPGAGAPAAAGERTWEGGGVSVRLDGADCFVAGQHAVLGLGIRAADEAGIKTARLVFQSLTSVKVTKRGEAEARWYYVRIEPADGPEQDGYRPFRAKLPRPVLDATGVNYYAEVTTARGTKVRTDVVSGPVMRSTEDCRSLGRSPAEAGPPEAVTVWREDGTPVR